eukprot:2403954-Rhodomonas_salina.5
MGGADVLSQMLQQVSLSPPCSPPSPLVRSSPSAEPLQGCSCSCGGAVRLALTLTWLCCAVLLAAHVGGVARGRRRGTLSCSRHSVRARMHGADAVGAIRSTG